MDKNLGGFERLYPVENEPVEDKAEDTFEIEEQQEEYEQEPENPGEVLAEGEIAESPVVSKPRSRKEIYEEIRALSRDLFQN